MKIKDVYENTNIQTIARKKGGKRGKNKSCFSCHERKREGEREKVREREREKETKREGFGVV